MTARPCPASSASTWPTPRAAATRLWCSVICAAVPAAGAYLAAVRPPSARPGSVDAGLRWLRRAPRQIGQAPRWIRRAPRQRQALAGGIALLAVVGVTGLTLTLAAS